jgi:hypothetical protein
LMYSTWAVGVLFYSLLDGIYLKYTILYQENLGRAWLGD